MRSCRVKSECTANSHTHSEISPKKKGFFIRIHSLGKAAFSINGLNLVFCDIEMTYCFDMLHLARKSNPRTVNLTTALWRA